MNNVDYDKKKFKKDPHGNLIRKRRPKRKQRKFKKGLAP